MENKKVIQVKDLTKMYKLYDKPSDSDKAQLCGALGAALFAADMADV